MKHLKRFNEGLEDYISDGERPLERPSEKSNDYLSEQNIEDQFNKWFDSIDYTEADYVSFKAGYKSAFDNIEYFESNNELDEQDKERAKRNQISNFPHSAKEDAKKREKIEKRARKEDPDGMYPRDDKRYDDSNDSKGGWQDGMGKPSWLGESFEDEDLILSLMKDKGWGDLSYNRIEDFKSSDYYKDPIDETEFVEQFDDYLYSQEGFPMPSWLGESIAEDYLDELYHKGAISSDVYEITREEEEDLSGFKGTDSEIKNKLLKHLNYVGGISSDVYQMELEELEDNRYRDLPDMTYKPKNYQSLTDEDGMPW